MFWIPQEAAVFQNLRVWSGIYRIFEYENEARLLSPQTRSLKRAASAVTNLMSQRQTIHGIYTKNRYVPPVETITGIIFRPVRLRLMILRTFDMTT